MMLVAVAHGIIPAEFFVGAVVRIDQVAATVLQPCGRSLDTEMVVSFPGQFALSVAAFQYALCEGDGSRYAVASHLLHGKFHVF